VIKIRQSNGIWISIDTNESVFDSYKDKRFVECKLTQSTSCAVVSRLKLDTVLINRRSSGRFLSSADPRLTIQWPVNVSETDIRLNLRIQPVELSTFTQFSENFSHECRGLLAVGPIIDLNSEEVTLLKPVQFTSPMLVQTKKNAIPTKPITTESNVPTTNSTSQPSQQEIIQQQQQSIFKSMLGEGKLKNSQINNLFFFNRFRK
jgi:hypothetical protein